MSSKQASPKYFMARSEDTKKQRAPRRPSITYYEFVRLERVTETDLEVGAIVTDVITVGLAIRPAHIVVILDVGESRIDPSPLGQIVVITNTEALGLIVLEFVSLEFHVFGAQRTGSTDRNGHTS